MRCASQPSGTGQTVWLDRIRRIATAIALASAFGLMMAAAPVHAQSPTPTPPTPTPTPTPSPTPVPTPTAMNYDRSAGNTTLDLGSNFLERLGNQASNGFNRSLRSNPGGGGASEEIEAPRYRTWFEGYGISARTEAQGDFVGDKSKTYGGVAGFGARLAPGVNVGFSVD